MLRKVIRFRKKGIKFSSVFDLIVCYKNNKKHFVEKIGFLDLNKNSWILFINLQRLGFWLNHGAFLNFSVQKYLVKLVQKR